MSDVVLGFDPSKRKLGWGCVHDATGQPLGCGWTELDGSPEQMAEAVARLDVFLDGQDLHPVFALIEYPFGGRGGGHTILESGVALGYLEMAARLRWPWLTFDRMDSKRWRKRAGVPDAPSDLSARSRAKRAWLKQADIDRARDLGFTLPTTGIRVIKLSDDAADGALLAYAGWRMLEAGDAVRVTA